MRSLYLKANSKFEAVRSRLNAHIRNMITDMQTYSIDLQAELEQISEQMKKSNHLAEAAGIDSIITALKERQIAEKDLYSYIMNTNQE